MTLDHVTLDQGTLGQGRRTREAGVIALLPVRVAHQITGRTRLVVTRACDGDELSACAARITASGLARAEARPRSNGLVLGHDQPWSQLVPQLEQAGLQLSPATHGPVRLPKRGSAAAGGPPSHPIGAAYDLFTRSNAAVATASGGRLDIANAAFVVLLASGVVQLARGQIAGPALSLFSQALTLAVLHGKSAPR